MADTKVLQAILDGQVQIRDDIKKFKSEVNDRFDKVDERIDKLGLQIANLEDDAPTNDELDSVKDRIKNLEQHFVSA